MPINECLSKPAVQIAGAVILPNLGGIAGGLITSKNIKTWFENLKHPSFRPPNRVFGPVWTTLYCGMGYGSYLVYKHGGGFNGAARLPLMLYGTQLALNWAWSPLFFHFHQLKWSFVEIVALTGTASVTALAFYGVNKTAGLLFLPYLAWLSFASYLNYTYYRLNTPAIEDKPEEKKA